MHCLPWPAGCPLETSKVPFNPRACLEAKPAALGTLSPLLCGGSGAVAAAARLVAHGLPVLHWAGSWHGGSKARQAADNGQSPACTERWLQATGSCKGWLRSSGRSSASHLALALADGGGGHDGGGGQPGGRLGQQALPLLSIARPASGGRETGGCNQVSQPQPASQPGTSDAAHHRGLCATARRWHARPPLGWQPSPAATCSPAGAGASGGAAPSLGCIHLQVHPILGI